MPRRASPRACPKCGSCDVVKPARGSGDPWRCRRCEYERQTTFPTVMSLRTGPREVDHRWQANVGQGGHRYMPSGNKYS